MVTDRFERRLVLIAASVLRGICVGVLGALSIAGVIQLWQIVVIVVVYGAGMAFQGPAAGAIIPDLVPAKLLVQANSLSQVVRQLAMAFIGPAVGGLVVGGVGPGSAFLVDGASFAIAILTLSMLRPRLAAAQPGYPGRSDRRECARGNGGERHPRSRDAQRYRAGDRPNVALADDR